jgi:hypothetical protein
VLVLGAVSILLVSLHVGHYTKLSPIDELQHVDYLFKSPHVVAPADKVGNDALREEACRGVDAPGFVVPAACSRTATYDPEAFQEKGYNTAAGYTPLYYTITHAAAKVVQALTPVSDLVTAGRLVGALWLWLGLVLSYLAGRRLGVRHWPLLGVLVLAAATPSVLLPSATVTPDAASIATGGLMLLLTVWWEQQPRGRTWAPVLGAAVVATLKITNVVVVAGCGAYLLLRWWQQRRSREQPAGPTSARTRLRDYPVAGVLMVGAAVTASVAWTHYVATLPQQDPADLPDLATRFHVDAFPWNGVLESALALVNPLGNPTVVVGSLQLVMLVTELSSYLVMAGLVGAAFLVPGRPRVAALGRAWLAAAVLCCVGLIALGYLAQSQYFPIPPRYGASLVPGACVLTAALVRNRFGTVAVWSIALVCTAITAYRLLTLS